MTDKPTSGDNVLVKPQLGNTLSLYSISGAEALLAFNYLTPRFGSVPLPQREPRHCDA
jgi:hypothetical protein